MSVVALPAGPYEAVFNLVETGLVGTAEWKVEDNQGNTVFGPTSAQMIESPAGSGLYAVEGTAPGSEGHYAIIASSDGTFAVGTVAVEDLFVTEAGAIGTIPPNHANGRREPVLAGTRWQPHGG